MALRDERHLIVSEAIEGAMTLELLPHFTAAVGSLRGAHARRRGNIEKFVAHGGAPAFGSCYCPTAESIIGTVDKSLLLFKQ
jgi:hypothetical protein